MKQVYISTYDVPFAVVFLDATITVKQPFIESPPNADIKKPKYNWQEGKWTDLSKIEEVSLKKRVEDIEEALMMMSLVNLEGEL